VAVATSPVALDRGRRSGNGEGRIRVPRILIALDRIPGGRSLLPAADRAVQGRGEPEPGAGADARPGILPKDVGQAILPSPACPKPPLRAGFRRQKRLPAAGQGRVLRGSFGWLLACEIGPHMDLPGGALSHCTPTSAPTAQA
jgi:hypothetical protein